MEKKSRRSSQVITGKSLEYTLLNEFYEKLKSKTNIRIINNSPFKKAKGYFHKLSNSEKSRYMLTSSFVVNFLLDIEPRLQNSINDEDILELEIAADHFGKRGDVRDVIVRRPLQNWSIGVSAKNNNCSARALRLSKKIDFGAKWMGVESSKDYFNTITPIFDELNTIRIESNRTKKWRDIDDYRNRYYSNIMDAFTEELMNINKNNDVSSRLVHYLIGLEDFYNVTQYKNNIEIQALNINGSLNLPFRDIQPKFKTSLVNLPSKIQSINKIKCNTCIVKMDKNWIISLRIHTASSRVEPSLKFDIKFLNSPKTMFKNTLSVA